MCNASARIAVNLDYTCVPIKKSFDYKQKAHVRSNLGESLHECLMLAVLARCGDFALNNYRVYRLDGAGKIIAAEWIEAAEDSDALREAHALASGASFELWLKARLVERRRA